jgi:hypothetical protein
MKKPSKKLQLNKETVTTLTKQKMVIIAGGSEPSISATRGTIYHCPSYPNACYRDVV